jgi:hypothetical protein
MKINFLIPVIIISFLSLNCEKDSESDLTAPVPTIVKYTTSIKPIMDNKCNGCHNGSTATQYLNFQQAKNAISGVNGILDRIQRNQADSQVMPQGSPKLSQADINLFLKWQADGLLE